VIGIRITTHNNSPPTGRVLSQALALLGIDFPEKMQTASLLPAIPPPVPARPTPPFYVIGHKNPDTDAICSAIGHAALLRTSGEQPDALAARCGDIPQRTAWVLKRAKTDAPALVTDVRTTAGMICHRDVVSVHLTDTFLTAYRRMLASGVRCVPVTDDDGKIHGVLRYLDLLELLLPAQTEGLSVRTVHVSLAKIAATLEAVSRGADMPPADDEEDLILLVGASSQTTVDKRLELANQDGNAGQFLVICGDRPIVQRYAIERGARALLVTGNNPVSEEICQLARRKGIVLLTCAQDTASASTLIRCSRAVRYVMATEFTNVCGTEPVSRLRKRLASSKQDLFPVFEGPEKTFVGVLSKSDLIDPPRIRLALVDHNEYAQAVNGVEEAEVVEVIDHHRLAGDLVSREPIRYLNEPVGSTSTLVARKFLHRDLTPEAGVAMCLCAGIVSDTLCLTSPTTTQLDRDMLTWLGKIAEIDPAKFTEEFFAVGSLLATGTPEAILNADRKEFTEDGFKVSISQVEERGLQGFEARREELENHLRGLAATDQYDLAVLAVTDITGHHSLILAIGQDAILGKMPFQRLDAALFDAPGVVSRKKQLFPAICAALHHAK
jgi:manganese-dependent inorganic pyrophosphatase